MGRLHRVGLRMRFLQPRMRLRLRGMAPWLEQPVLSIELFLMLQQLTSGPQKDILQVSVGEQNQISSDPIRARRFHVSQ